MIKVGDMIKRVGIDADGFLPPQGAVGLVVGHTSLTDVVWVKWDSCATASGTIDNITHCSLRKLKKVTVA